MRSLPGSRPIGTGPWWPSISRPGRGHRNCCQLPRAALTQAGSSSPWSVRAVGREVVAAIWPLAIVQTCIIHLLRNTFRLTSRQDVDAIKRDIRPIYTAPTADAASAALGELEEKWGDKYGAMIRLWRNAWNEFIPFLDYDTEIRKVICSTNAIESLNARYRRAVRARGHFPSEQAALKCLYLVTRSLDPTGTGRTRWTMRWKPVINAFAITFGDRWPAAETY
jgi:putative transposase